MKKGVTMEKFKYNKSENELKEQYSINEIEKQEERYCLDIEEMKEKNKKLIAVGLTIIFSIPAVGIILIWIAYAVNMFMTNAEGFSDIKNYIPLFVGIGWLLILYIFRIGSKAIIKNSKQIDGK